MLGRLNWCEQCADKPIEQRGATTPVAPAIQQADAVPLPAQKPVIVEWVYRIQYGHHDEWWRIFKKYQIAILERQKQLGYVKEYTVFAPSLHTSEDSRWDYRIIIVRASEDPPPGQFGRTFPPYTDWARITIGLPEENRTAQPQLQEVSDNLRK